MQTITAKSATESLTDAIQRQKVTLKQHRKEVELRNAVMKEQYAIQRMSAMGWTENGAGRISADTFMPRSMPAKLGEFSNLTQGARTSVAAFSEALAGSKLRVGVWAESLASASTNVVNMGKNMQWAGRQMMVGLTLPIAAVAAGTAALAFGVDKEMTRVLRVYDYTSAGINASAQETANSLAFQQESLRKNTMQTAKTMASAYGIAVKDTVAMTSALAAIGRTGAQLQQDVAVISKGMFLGELDQEDALKTAITLLTVYHKTGETAIDDNKRLGESFAYLNNLENATSLTMKDMTVAIPRLSGVMKSLGGTVQDIGTLMTASKAGGLDAAEGANMLRTVLFRAMAPTNRGKETFIKATGMELSALAKTVNYEAIPMLQKMSQVMEGLSKEKKIEIAKDVFGVYQGSKALNVINQMLNLSDATTQAGKAALVGAAGFEEWNRVQAREVLISQNSASGKFTRALEATKQELVELGMAFIPVGTAILKVVKNFTEGFNDLSKFNKGLVMVMAGIVGIAGPIIMVTGTIRTFIGSVMGGIAALGKLATGFKLVTADQQATAIVAKQAQLAFDNETLAANTLAAAIAKVNSQLVALAGTQRAAAASTAATQATLAGATPAAAAAAGKAAGAPIIIPPSAAPAGSGAAPLPVGVTQTKGRYYDNVNGKKVRMSADAVAARQAAEAAERQAKAATAAAAAGAVGAANAAKTAGIWRGMTRPMTTIAGVMVLLSSNGNRWIQALGVALLIFGQINVKAAAIAALTATTLATQKASAVIAATQAQSVTKTGGAIKGALPAAGAFAKSLATSIGPLGLIGIGLGAAAATLLIMKKRSDDAIKSYEKLGELSKSAAEIMGIAYNDAGAAMDDMNNGAAKQITLQGEIAKQRKDEIETISKMGEGDARREIRNIGIRFFQSTANEQGANDLMQTLARLTGNEDMATDIVINFKDSNSGLLIDNLKENIEKMTSGSWGKTTMEAIGNALGGMGGEGGTSAELTRKAKALGEDRGKTIAEGINNALVSGDAEGATKLVEKIEAVWRNKMASNKNNPTALKLDEEAYRNFLDIVSVTVTGAAGKYDNLNQIVEIFPEIAMKAANSSQGLASGMEGAGDAAGGLAMGFKDATEAQKAYIDSAKGVMSTVVSDIAELAAEQATESHEAETKSLEDQGKKRIDLIEAEAKRMEKVFSNRDRALGDSQASAADRLDSRWKASAKALQKQQEAARKTLEAVYDARIEKIEATIEAEEKAEENRKRMFEAEKERISQLADMENKSIDLNMSLNSGDMDSAAKISNDIRATQEQWALDAAQKESDGASNARVESLNNDRDRLGEQKSAAVERLQAIQEAQMESLRAREEAEKTALKASQERQKRALEDEKRRYQDGVAANKQAEEEKTRKAVEASNRRYAVAKRAIDQEMAALKAAIPTNQKELNTHVANVEALYRGHGFKLNTQSQVWSKYVANSMKAATATAAAQLENDVNWGAIGDKAGAEIANAILNMSFPQFMHWMKTDELPATPAPVSKPDQTGDWVARNAAKAQAPPGGMGWGAYHSGGPIQSGSGSGRAGRSLSANLRRDEVPIIAQRGEYMIQREAVNRIGIDNLHALNNGGVGPDRTGRMHSGGIVGGIGAMISGIFKKGLAKAVQIGTQRKVNELAQQGNYSAIPQPILTQLMGGMTEGKAGKYGNSTLSAEQLSNAAKIVNVGRSMGASNRDLIIGLMTALQESGLRNISGGDRDSAGLFQQRPSQGWGSIQQVTDPEYASRKFFTALMSVAGRHEMPLTAAAQAVQRSAYPNAYSKWEDEARAILAGGTTAPGMAFSAGMLPGSYTSTKPFSAFGGTVTGDVQGLKLMFLTRLAKWSAAVGQPYNVGSGYRSLAEQQVLYDRWIRRVPGQAPAAKPGSSNHNWGLAADGPHWGGLNPGLFGLRYPMSYEPWHVEPMGASALRAMESLPGLKVGGKINYDNTIANLHKNETVLTAPLSKSLESGIKKIDGGANNHYDITMDFRGALIREDIDIEKAVTRVLTAHESKMGRKRVVR